MKLVHYGGGPVGTLHTVDPGEDAAPGKPLGFWFSVESDDGKSYGWREWCLHKDYGLDRLTHVHDVTLAADARILRLTGAAALDAFTIARRKPMFPHMPDPPGSSSFYNIDWRAVGAEWQGVIIAPYVWSRRMELMWYYGWDCASGCVWDAMAIERVTLREVVQQPVAQSDWAAADDSHEEAPA